MISVKVPNPEFEGQTKVCQFHMHIDPLTFFSKHPDLLKHQPKSLSYYFIYYFERRD